MNRFRPVGWRLLACFLCLSCRSAGAAVAPYSGTWQVTVLMPGQEATLLLVEVVEKASGPKVTLLSAGIPPLEDATLEASRGDGDDLLITVRKDPLVLTFLAHPPPGEAAPKTMLGGCKERQGPWEFVRWERTDLKEIDRDTAPVSKPEAKELARARQLQDNKERIAALKELADRHDADVLGYFAGLDLVGALALVGAPEADVRGRAEKVVTIAASYGPPMKLQALSQVARKLVASGQVPQVAVAFARRAENSLNPTTPEADQVPVLKTLARALRRAGQADEASQVATRIAKLDDYLDRVFLEDAIPFRPKRYDGREDKSSRVAVVELFTGVQCPPCVAADVAFDALLKTYQPKDVVCLQYHLHAPGPDPLTNDDTEKRAGFYDVDSTPAFFINGKKGPAVGGFKSMAKSAYDTLVEALREPLQAESQTALELAARRTGDGLDITAKVSSPKMPGREVRLLLVLLEERVHFAGRNGQRLHHHVVRAFPGGAEGLSIREPTVAQKVRVSFKELADSLHSYLGRLRFEEDEQPLELKHLKVAALIQDSKSKEVLQAKQVDVSGARSE